MNFKNYIIKSYHYKTGNSLYVTNHMDLNKFIVVNSYNIVLYDGNDFKEASKHAKNEV